MGQAKPLALLEQLLKFRILFQHIKKYIQIAPVDLVKMVAYIAAVCLFLHPAADGGLWCALARHVRLFHAAEHGSLAGCKIFQFLCELFVQFLHVGA